MKNPHPGLRLRPRSRAGLNRPTISHPVLGSLVRTDRGGVASWYGQNTVSGTFVRIAIVNEPKLGQQRMDEVAGVLAWVQQHEPVLRQFIAAQIAAGSATSNLANSIQMAQSEVEKFLNDLRPCEFNASAFLELVYCCDLLPGGNLQGVHRIGVTLDPDNKPTAVHLYALANDRRADALFVTPVPPEIADFVDSTADQFLAAADNIQWNEELREILNQARADIQRRLASCSEKAREYLVQASNILVDMEKDAMGSSPTSTGGVQPQIVRVCFDLECTHSSGKFDPFKKKLTPLKDDNIQFDRADGKAILRFDLIFRHSHPAGAKGFESFNKAVEKTLLKIGKWLAKQSPTAFQEVRDAGYQPKFVLSVLQATGQDAVTLDLPTDFLTECAKHAVPVSTVHEYEKS